MVTNRNKKRAPKYSQKRKEIARIKGRQRGWKWGAKTEHRNGCQKETSKIMKKKTGVIRIGIAKNEICGKGRPLSRHPMTLLFSSFYNALSHEILIFFCALRALLKVLSLLIMFRTKSYYKMLIVVGLAMIN